MVFYFKIVVLVEQGFRLICEVVGAESSLAGSQVVDSC